MGKRAEGGDSAGEYGAEKEALRAVRLKIEHGGGSAPVRDLVLAKVGPSGELVRLAAGDGLAAAAEDVRR